MPYIVHSAGNLIIYVNSQDLNIYQSSLVDAGFIIYTTPNFKIQKSVFSKMYFKHDISCIVWVVTWSWIDTYNSK